MYTKWTIETARQYLRYSLACPKGVNPLRWRAMIRQIGALYGFGWMAAF